ncbi:hypothetical protein [Arthrobacter koreensis]|uniref:hypothetical protein n=1 Tax=Arthrobacter koreensis TaxID=199136 RepID=UPI003813C149
MNNAEPLSAELVEDGPETTSNTTGPTAEPAQIRTAAFLSDGRTSAWLIEETLDALISQQSIQEAVVDISTDAGVAIARHLLELEIDYSIFDTAPPKWEDAEGRRLLKQLRAHAKALVPLDPDNLADIDANVVLVPAPAADAGPGIDAAEGTITALVIDQMQAADQSCLLILPPESGLRRRENGDYVRLTIRLSE